MFPVVWFLAFFRYSPFVNYYTVISLKRIKKGDLGVKNVYFPSIIVYFVDVIGIFEVVQKCKRKMDAHIVCWRFDNVTCGIQQS